MGVPKRLTDMQMRFAEFIVFGGVDGPMTQSEAAIAAGYSKARCKSQEGSRTNESQRYSPLVVQYVGDSKRGEN